MSYLIVPTPMFSPMEDETLQAFAMNRRASSSCPRGQILRKGYTRSSKSGKRVRVAPTCIKDRGAPGRGPKILPTPKKPGYLRGFGYSLTKSAAARRRALSKAIKHEGDALKVYRRLILIHNFQHRINPKVAKKIKSDYEWIKSKHFAK